MKELIKYNITDVLNLLKKKEIMVSELVKAYIDAIKKTHNLNMYVETCFENALKSAEKSDQKYKLGNNRPRRDTNWCEGYVLHGWY